MNTFTKAIFDIALFINGPFFCYKTNPWVPLTVSLLLGSAQGFELTQANPCDSEKSTCSPSSILLNPEGQTFMQLRSFSEELHREHALAELVDLDDGDELKQGRGFIEGGDLFGLRAQVTSEFGLKKPSLKLKKKSKSSRSSYKGRNGWYGTNSGPKNRLILNVSCGSPIEFRDAAGSFCPGKCPYFAERQEARKYCIFECVKADNCGKKSSDPLARVHDPYLGICRRCFVTGCKQCAPGGADICAACTEGYSLKDGQCVSTFIISWVIVIAISSVLIAFILVWLVDLFCRPSVNLIGVEEGDAYRSVAILRRERPAALEDEAGSSKASDCGKNTPEGPYPLSTNLTRNAIAGRGTLLFFNFQLALIVWSLLLLVGWYCTVVLADGSQSDLFKLGTQPAQTPLDYCSVIHWGYTRQHALLWVKWSFCFGSYALSFILAVAYSAKQTRTYMRLDATQTTMMDYAAHIWDLPKESGSAKVEDELQTFLGTRSGENVAGVSVCWDTHVHSSSIDVFEEADHLGRRLKMNSSSLAVSNREELPQTTSKNPIRMTFDWVDSLLCCEPGSDVDSCSSRADMIQALTDTTSTGHAFVVFETEAARDKAVELAQHSHGFSFKGCQIQLEACAYEPTSVLWENFGIDDAQLPMRMLIAALILLVFLLVWVFAFFLPAAYFAIQYSDARGESGDFVYNVMFALLVVIGNQIMYNVSLILASKIGFKYEDIRQSAYVIMYVTACTVNVVMDFVFLAKTSYREMIARGVRTDDGTEIGLLDKWNKVFESYAMQREIGSRLASYAWPSTFLVPFVLEGVMTLLLPYILQRNLVRSKRGIVGIYAERSMMHFVPMDLSRYGDVVLNVMLIALMFFMPPGFLFQLMLGLLLSHIYIYVYDHYRVLRSVPAFSYTNDHTHKAAECLLAVPVGLLLSAGVFKSNCEVLSNGISLPCSQGWTLLGRCIMVFALHVCLHLFLLLCVIPRLEVAKEEPSTIPYEVAAQTIPHNWFTTNPMHCLRSAYIYNHNMPHIFLRSERA